jgi:hypothetical protein
VLASSVHWGTIVIGLFTGITAAVGAGLLVMAWRAHHLDRALTGTSKSVVATPGYSAILWESFHVTGISPGWDAEHTRWTSVRFVNRARAKTTVLPPPYARLGWLRRRIEVSSGRDNVVPPDDPKTLIALLRREQPWGRRRFYRLSMTWVTGGGEPVKVRRYVRLREIGPLWTGPPTTDHADTSSE